MFHLGSPTANMLHYQVGEFLSLLHNITKLRIAYSAKKRL